MKSSIKALFGTTALAVISSFAVGSTPAAANVCPAFGADTDCGFVVTIHPGGSLTIVHLVGQGPYDGGDDTLIGVINNSGTTVSAIHLSSSVAAFSFDGSDGIQGFGSPAPGPAGLPPGYEL